MHMAAARFDCKRAMVGTGWANSRPSCMNRLIKRYSHLLGLAGKASWAPGRCLPTENPEYCMLVNEWARLRPRACLLSLKVHLGSVLESELRQK